MLNYEEKRENRIYCSEVNVCQEGRASDRARGKKSICVGICHERMRGKS